MTGRPKTRWRSLHWRALAAALVFGLVIAAFAGGATTSSYPDPTELSPLAWLYFAGSLFVFGGTDLGVPLTTAGPLPAALLWVAYFLAPLITTTVLIDAVVRLLGARAAPERNLDQHVVIIGSDALTLASVDVVKTVDPSRWVLLAEHRAGLDHLEFDQPDRAARLLRARGDLLRPANRERLALTRAHRAIVISADDSFNLQCAWAFCEACPTLPVATHVADLGLLRPVSRILRAQRTEGAAVRVPAVFSTNRIAALLLYDEHLEPQFADTRHDDLVFVAGFGHLGQTLAELLIARGEAEIARLLVIDPNAQSLCRQFRADVEPGALRPEPVMGELTDPATWRTALQLANATATADIQGPAADGSGIVLLTADAQTNLKTAVLLRALAPGLDLYAIEFTRNAFTDAVAAQLSMRVLYLEEELPGALRDHYEALSAS